ncbi:calcium load-activated calcium channel isoform X1 [Neodiprion pinetum]|uniref:calcium load-activated calcium channel isoform X1 n=1 Tax=Neodiprion pinetum TaxID=441929 RepID=UPI001EDCABE1|nr:calcium load-activated calcium channel isoform X1 [Neodiprion pinetum]
MEGSKYAKCSNVANFSDRNKVSEQVIEASQILMSRIFWSLILQELKIPVVRVVHNVPVAIPEIEKRKEAHGDSLDKQQKKKIEREEERLKNNNRDLSLVKMKSMFAIGFAFTALLSMFNSIFDGRVVARLPFTPISWIQGLSHRNLPGDDYMECSFIFLYILCTMSIRQNIQKLLGFAPSRTASKQSGSIFGPPPQQFK